MSDGSPSYGISGQRRGKWCRWRPELSEHTDQQPLAACTLPRSANEHARAQTRGHDVGLRRQVGRSWRRSKRQFALCLQACPAAHIAGHEDTHPDELPPGSDGASPSRPCEPMGATTIIRCFLALSTLSPLSPAEAEHGRMTQDSSQVVQSRMRL